MAIGTPYLIGTQDNGSTVTVATATAAGDAIFVTCSTAASVSGITDTQGNTYVQLPSDTVNDAYLFAATYKGSAGTPTAALSTSDTISLSSSAGQIVAGGCSGLAAAAADKTPAFTSGTGTAVTAGPSGTLSQASELAVAALGTDGTSSLTWGSGFTAVGSAIVGGVSLAGLAALPVASTASVTATATFGTSQDWSAFLATFKAAAAPSKFTAPRTARGRPAAARGTGKGGAGAKYVSFPSKFTPPRKPARGAQAARRGTPESSPGAKYIHVTPPGPSPFTLPAGPARGKPAAVRGRAAASPGAPYFHVSAFALPARPAKGTAATRRGAAASSPGAKWVAVTRPSPFTLPHRPAAGKPAAVRGVSRSSPGARFVFRRPSPFTLPRTPARGMAAIRRGRGAAGSATGQGAPQVPRQLIIVLASQAGTDDYGNTFSVGVTAGSALNGPQVALLPQVGQAAELQFPISVPALAASPNVAGNVNEAAGFAVMEVSGPELAASGLQDWVQLALFSDDTAGDGAHMDFRFIDTTGSVTVTATYDASGWTFQDPVTINNTLDVVTTLTAGALNVTDGSTFGQLATFDEGISTGNVFMSPPMAIPSGYPYSTDGNTGSTWATGERSYINQLVDGLNGLVASLINRGFIT